MKKYPMRKSNALGFEMYTADPRSFRRSRFPKIHADTIVLAGLLIGLVVAGGMLLHQTVVLANAVGEYVEADFDAQHDAYQMQQVMEALAEQRGVHPVTGAEMPPYWNVEESIERNGLRYLPTPQTQARRTTHRPSQLQGKQPETES